MNTLSIFSHGKILMLITGISFFVACNNQKKEEKQEQELKENVTPSMLTSTICYSYTNNKDTVLLKTITVNDSVTGTLVYKYYQKDRNSGTIEGKIKDDLLIADYTFLSEGVRSVRQVVFKKIGEIYKEGYGEIENKDGKTVFKNISSLDFSQSVVLTKVECEK